MRFFFLQGRSLVRFFGPIDNDKYLLAMCGVTGYLSPGGFSGESAKSTLLGMRDSLLHRGPDDAGIWFDESVGVALGHRRLSVLDLSRAGRQPMLSQSGRYVIVFNGEIYNHETIRQKLQHLGRSDWRGQSDTESLLAAIECWGLERALTSLIGMFAFALWDRKERKLFLARDRLGEKPLYYGWHGGVFLFGSELSALRAHPAFKAEISHDSLSLYLRYGYIPAPQCIWADIKKLTPGTWVSIGATDRNTEVFPQTYWSLRQAALVGEANPFKGSDEEAIESLDTVLKASVAGQLAADVPVGAFLSGGVDSSTVAALMQAHSSQRVKTFTVGFRESSYDEAVHARRIADHLGTDHTELYVTAAEARKLIPDLPRIYTEPFGDSSAIPTYLVSQLAGRQVTVSLSGDGGDELFGGYDRYLRYLSLWKSREMVPVSLRRVLSRALRSDGPRYLNSAVKRLAGFAGNPFGRSLVDRSHRVADLLDSSDYAGFYRVATSHWNPPPTFSPIMQVEHGLSDQMQNEFINTLDTMMAQDSVTYLPDGILVKVDRAAMAVGLETRVPLLDHRVVELAWRMPAGLKVRDGQGKWLLRKVLDRYVPKELTNRPKMGFGVPMDQWLRGPLREWGENLLGENRIRQEGFLDSTLIRKRWDEHQRGENNWCDSLWLVLMWQSWLEANR